MVDLSFFHHSGLEITSNSVKWRFGAWIITTDTMTWKPVQIFMVPQVEGSEDVS